MQRSSLLALVAMLAAGTAVGQQSRIQTTLVGNDLVVRLGPVMLMAHADHGSVDQLTLQTFQTPVGGWLRGYRAEMVDEAGRPLPQELLHHAELVDLERRDLLRTALNRVVSVGKETAPIMLPPGMGYPIRRGQTLGINSMVHNPTDTDYHVAYVRVTLTVTPDTVTPPLRNVLGFYAETSPAGSSSGDNTANATSSFDLPAGPSQQVVTFTVPVAGQVLGVGGHIHDFGEGIVLVRTATGDTLYNAVPRKDSTGEVLGMPLRPMFGRALHIAAGERFVMTVRYNNTSGRMLAGAGMGTLAVVFIPDDMAAWPALDPNAPGVLADLASLRSKHQAMMEMHMH